MSRLILVDGNSVGNAASRVKMKEGEPLGLPDGTPTKAIFGFLKSIRKVQQRFPDYQMVILWDGRAQWRYELFPGYKDRTPKNTAEQKEREVYKQQVPLIKQAIGLLGLTQLLSPKSEADDIAAYLARKITADKYSNAILMTADKDWVQLVSRNVLWLDHRTDTIVNARNFSEISGAKDSQEFIQRKALYGDSSDTIPGVGGIGEKVADKFFAEYGSVDAFFNDCATGLHVPKTKVLQDFWHNEIPKRKQKYPTPMRDAYNRNIALMDLSKAPVPMDLEVEKGVFDQDAFEEFCMDHEFASILNNLDEWVAPFKKEKPHE